VGRNCNLLQGEGTEKELVHRLANGIRACKPCEATLANYTVDGDPFQHSAGDGAVSLFNF